MGCVMVMGCVTESQPSAVVLKWKDTNQTEGTPTLKDDTP